jgi:hypothetical protein
MDDNDLRIELAKEIIIRSRKELDRRGVGSRGKVRLGALAISKGYTESYVSRHMPARPAHTIVQTIVKYPTSKWMWAVATEIGKLEDLEWAADLLRQHQILDDLADA